MPRRSRCLLSVVSASVLIAGCGSKPSPDSGSQPHAVTRGGSAATPPAVGQAPGSASAATGQGTGAAAAVPAGPPATSLALIQQWGAANLHLAAENLRVTPAGLKVPGVELYWLSDGRPVPDDDDAATRLVGVIGGTTGKIVEDRELLLAVIAARPGANALARIAIGVAQRDGDVLDKAEGPEQHKAKVTAPAMAGNTFSFWVWTHEVPRSLEHGVLDMTTGVLELAPPPMSHDEAIARAIATLNGVSVGRHASAIKILADACKDPRALQGLLRAVESHPRVKSRVAVADQIHHCGPPAVDTLITAMAQDKSSVVRQAAAVALGRIGDGRARAALAKAGRGEDANLASAAKSALAKLR